MYLPLVSKMVIHSHLNPGGGEGGGVKGAAKEAIDQHPSKPLISLVPITCTTHCFQGWEHCYATIRIVFSANHKPG